MEPAGQDDSQELGAPSRATTVSDLGDMLNISTVALASLREGVEGMERTVKESTVAMKALAAEVRVLAAQCVPGGAGDGVNGTEAGKAGKADNPRSKEAHSKASVILESLGALSLAQIQTFIARGMDAARYQEARGRDVPGDENGTVFAASTPQPSGPALNFLEQFNYTAPTRSKNAVPLEGSSTERENWLRQSSQQLLRQVMQETLGRPIRISANAALEKEGAGRRVAGTNENDHSRLEASNGSRRAPSTQLHGVDGDIHDYSVNRFRFLSSARGRPPGRTAPGRAEVDVQFPVPPRAGLEILDDVHSTLQLRRLSGTGGLVQQLEEFAQYLEITPQGGHAIDAKARNCAAGVIKKVCGQAQQSPGKAKEKYGLAFAWISSLTRLLFDNSCGTIGPGASPVPEAAPQSKRQKKNRLRIVETREAKLADSLLKAVRSHIKAKFNASRNTIRMHFWTELGSRLYMCFRRREGFSVELFDLPLPVSEGDAADSSERKKVMGLLLPEIVKCDVLPQLQLPNLGFKLRPRLSTHSNPGSSNVFAETAGEEIPQTIIDKNWKLFQDLQDEFPLVVQFKNPLYPSDRPSSSPAVAAPLSADNPPAYIVQSEEVNLHDVALNLLTTASGLRGTNEVLASSEDSLRFLHTVAVTIWTAISAALREGTTHEDQLNADGTATIDAEYPPALDGEEEVLGSIRLFGISKSGENGETCFRSDVVPLILVQQLPWIENMAVGENLSGKAKYVAEDEHYLQKDKITRMGKSLSTLPWNDYLAMWRDRWEAGNNGGDGSEAAGDLDGEGEPNPAGGIGDADAGRGEEWKDMEGDMGLL